MKARSRFFYARVSILLGILVVVVLWAVRDVRSRRARTDWSATLDVAVVLVHVAGQRPVTEPSVRALRARTPALEQRLAAELLRHRGAGPPPFRFKVLGPVDVATGPPAPASDGVVDLAKQALDLASWLRDVDPRAGVVPDHYDARIYVAARAPATEVRSSVEGRSEQGGRIGMVDVELDEGMADVTLFVVAHELLHTLGADDAYDGAGRARVPDGLVEPERVPLYPQRFAEIMARSRPISATVEVLPESLDELAVGAVTARAIGWTR